MRMTYVQLGFLSKVLDWVLDHIIKPVFEFLGNIISEIFRAIFNTVLEPLFEKLLSFAIKIFKVVTFNILYDILFQIQRAVLSILSAIERCFRVLVGLDPVYVEGQKADSLLYALFMDRTILGILIAFMAASFILCFGMSIIGVLRSIIQMEGEGRMRKPVGHVMRQTGYALLRLLLVPAIGIAMVLLSSAVARSVDLATKKDSKATMATTIFTIATLNAVRPTPEFANGYEDAAFYNSTTRAAAMIGASDAKKKQVSDFGLTDKYRKDWYEGKRNYGSMTDILKTFDLQRIDFAISIGVGLLFIWLLGSACLMLVGRIFNLLILLLVEPFFAATIPWDDGQRFRKWSDTFTGMMFSGLGLLVGMNLYLSLISLIFSNKVAFFGDGTTESVIYIVDLLFVGVGGMAIKSVGPMVTSIMSASAGRQEADLMNTGGAIVGSAMNAAATPFIEMGKGAGKYVGGKIAGGITSLLSGSGDDNNAQPGKGDAFGGAGKTGAAARPTPGDSKINGRKPEDGGRLLPGQGSAGAGSAARRKPVPLSPLGLPVEDDHKYIVTGQGERKQQEKHKADLERDRKRREQSTSMYDLFGVERPQKQTDEKEKNNKFDGKPGTQLENQKREDRKKEEKNTSDQKDQKQDQQKVTGKQGQKQSMSDLIDGNAPEPGTGKSNDGRQSMKDILDMNNGTGPNGQQSMKDILGLNNGTGPNGEQSMKDILNLTKDPFDTNQSLLDQENRVFDQKQQEDRKKQDEQKKREDQRQQDDHRQQTEKKEMEDILGLKEDPFLKQQKEQENQRQSESMDQLLGLNKGSGDGPQSMKDMLNLNMDPLDTNQNLLDQENRIFDRKQQEEQKRQEAQRQQTEKKEMEDMLGLKEDPFLKQQKEQENQRQSESMDQLLGLNNGSNDGPQSMKDILGLNNGTDPNGQQSMKDMLNLNKDPFDTSQSLFDQENRVSAQKQQEDLRTQDEQRRQEDQRQQNEKKEMEDILGLKDDPFQRQQEKNMEELLGLKKDPFTEEQQRLNEQKQMQEILGLRDDPFGGDKDPFGMKNDPFAEGRDPFAMNDDPFAEGRDPFAMNDDPFAGDRDPFGMNSDPFAGDKDPFGMQNDPFAENKDPYGMNDNTPSGDQNDPFRTKNDSFAQNEDPYTTNQNTSDQEGI